MSIHEVELTKMQYVIQKQISRALAKDFAIKPEFLLEECPWSENLLVTLRQDIFGEQALFKLIEYPRDWWQALKERWFPEWAKKIWPVVYKSETFDARFLYPSVMIPDYVPILVTHVEK